MVIFFIGKKTHNVLLWHKFVKGREQHAHRLKTKKGTIKHDVAKFVGCYNYVFTLNESRTILKDVLSKVLKFYKLKYLKNVSIMFLHYRLLLKEVSQWSDSKEDPPI
jgi:hypothetical protein